MLESLQYVSIAIEVIIAIIGLLLLLKKKIYGIGILITFGIYVFYDLAKHLDYNISSDILYLVFLIASISMLFAAYKIYSEIKTKRR